MVNFCTQSLLCSSNELGMVCTFFFVLCVNLPSLLTGETQKSSRKPLRYYASDGGKPQCLEYSEIWLYYIQTAIIILNNGLQP